MRAVYSIASKDDGWFVRLNGKEFGPIVSLEEAAAGTIRAAVKAYARGCYAHVMVQQGKSFQTLWINGSLSPQLAA